jgi:murein hydrolase activator
MARDSNLRLGGILIGAAAIGLNWSTVSAQVPNVDEMRQKLEERRGELENAQEAQKASEMKRRAFETELETLKNDRARLAAALIETTAKAGATESRIAEVEKKLETSQASEEAIRRSLSARRNVIAAVLAALQRMGRRPPPAILVNPQDMLTAIRTSMLLGAVVPELRAETDALASDLLDLVSVRKSIAKEKEALAQESAVLQDERQRLSALVDARQRSLADAEQAIKSERDRAQALVRQATDLKDLIQRMETEVAAGAAAAEAARKSDDAQARAALEKPQDMRTRIAMGPFHDTARLAPAIPFAEAKGLLPMPASGTVLKSFGAPDGFGGVEKGLSLAVRAGATVASPTDGWVVFSGPYRSYGQLLIINAGGGYYVVLAGMERINVEVRQFVLAGEPVGAMGEGSTKTAAALAIGATQPILYVEFRKDGASIDPGPWWAKPEQEKVRG